MKCPLCGAALVDDQVSTVKRVVNGKRVFFQSVPSQICSNTLCRQIILHGTTVKKMRGVINKAKEEQIDLGKTFDFDKADKFLSSVEYV